MAEKYGYIGQAGAGTAILLTHKNQLETDGEEQYIYRQRSLFGIEVYERAERDSSGFKYTCTRADQELDLILDNLPQEVWIQ